MASEIKPISGLNRIKLAEVVPLDTPYTVFVFPTTFCNFKCIYCGHSLGSKKMYEQYGFKAENMTMETYTKIIQQLKKFNRKVKVLSLTGHGEPLLNKNITDMVKLAKQADVAERIEIITNASLLTNSLTEQLVVAGLDCLRVSIQGVTGKKYKEVCKYDIEFEEIVEKLTYFYQHKKECELFVKVMDIALEDSVEEEKFYKTFENISDRMFIEKCRPVYTGVEATQNLEVTADRYGREHEARKVCPLCFYMLGIFPNGDVEPCDTIYKPVVLGNIYETELDRMWAGKLLKEFRMTQLNMDRFSNPKCAECCAPDDVSHPEDQLDEYSKEIKDRL